MQGLFTLLSLGVLMAVASFLAGILPLSLSLSPAQLRLMSTVGMGVLVGTSLIVIIPEGMETIYSVDTAEHGHVRREIHRRNLEAQWSNTPRRTVVAKAASGVDPFLNPGPVLPDEDAIPPSTLTTTGSVGIMDNGSVEEGEEARQSPNDNMAEAHPKESNHVWIGVALISGFILMFLIDKVPQSTMPSKPNQQPYHISLNDLGRGLYRAPTTSHDEDVEGFMGSGSNRPRQTQSFATTAGLVIHAAADGIALGASSSAADTGLSFVIFFAIMVHKAPAAFGLTSVLLRQGVSKRSARGHLLLFSLAAPTGALLTWILAHSLGAGQLENEESTKWCTGMLLLFSGGTFLYVAMHTMQDTSSSHREIQANGNLHGFVGGQNTQVHKEKLSIKDLMAAVFGMILPLFLQVGHAH